MNKNSLLAGVLTGSIFPVIACWVYYMFKGSYYLSQRPALSFFIAIAVNLVFVRISHKKEFDKTMKGIMLATFIFMVVIFGFKLYPLK